MSEATDLPHHPAAALFPMLDDEAMDHLAEDIRANGLHEAVWLCRDPELGTVLLDGRNRVEACRRASVTPRTRFYEGDDPITFSISLNMRRRHLTPGQLAAVATDAEPLYAAEAARRKAHGQTAPGRTLGADRPQASEKPKRAPRARDRAAKAVGSNGRNTAKYKRLAEQAPDLAAKVRAGVMALDRAERVLRDRAAERRRIAEAKRAAEAAPVVATVDIRHGDFREVLADLHDVDAIVTDPPYPRQYLPLLADLAAWADKVLAPDGVLAVLMGQSHLPEVYRLLDGHRPYRWTGCYLAEGQATVVFGNANVQTKWKPILFYGAGPRFDDLIRTDSGNASARDNHRWGQDYGAFHTLLERVTRRGQTVVDPFMGSGTTLLAAHALGRHAIGCDVEAESVAKARERLA